jgi:hypothetical protein
MSIVHVVYVLNYARDLVGMESTLVPEVLTGGEGTSTVTSTIEADASRVIVI